MKGVLKILLITIKMYPITLYSQSHYTENYSNIANSNWEVLSFALNDSVVQNHNTTFYIFKDSFYYCMMTSPGLSDNFKDTGIISGGQWEVTQDNLLILEEHFTSNVYYSKYPDKIWIYKILFTSKDSIKLMYTSQGNPMINLKNVGKIDIHIPKIADTLLNEESFNTNFSKLPKKRLMLENKMTEKKTIVPFDKSFSLITFKKEINSETTKYYGKLITCDSNNLYIKLETREFWAYPLGGNIITGKTYYPTNPDTIQYPWIEYYRIEKIPYKNISSVTYYRQAKIENAIAYVFAGSLVSALVVAPLVSYNYRNGNFNQSRYYKIIVPSLITCGISIPISIISSHKNYTEIDNSKYQINFYPIE